jgi:hypothetical protein
VKLLGDIVEGIADAFGVKKCGGCEKRRQQLNDADRRVRDALSPKGSVEAGAVAAPPERRKALPWLP